MVGTFQDAYRRIRARIWLYYVINELPSGKPSTASRFPRMTKKNKPSCRETTGIPNTNLSADVKADTFPQDVLLDTIEKNNSTNKTHTSQGSTATASHAGPVAVILQDLPLPQFLKAHPLVTQVN